MKKSFDNTKYMNFTKSKIIKAIFIILVNFLINMENTNAQNNESVKKNAAYVSYGNIIFSSQISVSYERLIFEKNNMQTNAKVNFGKYLSNNADYETNAKVYQNFLSISAVHLVGLLEINGGISYAQFKLAKGFNPEPDIDYSELKQKIGFYGNVGIRYTKNKFLVRAGIGNVELLYLGIGLNF